MPHHIDMDATYPHIITVQGREFHVADVELRLTVAYERDRNGEVFDFWVEDIGLHDFDPKTFKRSLRWLPNAAWKDHLIQSALEYFRSSKFGEEVQEKVDEEQAWAA